SKLHSAMATDGDEGYDLLPYADLIEGTDVKAGNLRKRLDTMPIIFTHGRLQIDSNSPKAKCLYRLIRFRNDILHIHEGVETFGLEDERVRWINGEPQVNLQPPLYLWDRIGLDDARKFQAAVSS